MPGSYLLRALRNGALQAQGLASLDSGQTVDVPLQGILSLQAEACAQSNQNQIQVNAPGSTVNVNISNQNSCQVRF